MALVGVRSVCQYACKMLYSPLGEGYSLCVLDTLFLPLGGVILYACGTTLVRTLFTNSLFRPTSVVDKCNIQIRNHMVIKR